MKQGDSFILKTHNYYLIQLFCLTLNSDWTIGGINVFLSIYFKKKQSLWSELIRNQLSFVSNISIVNLRILLKLIRFN